MSTLYGRLVLALALTAGCAAGLLAFTYKTTAPTIAQREVEDQAKALEKVFFLQNDGENGSFRLEPREVAEGVVALFGPDSADLPVYYAVTGTAVGYNSSVPISLMVGFTGPAAEPADLLQGYIDEDRLPARGSSGLYIVGFSVINSEETPGLGEKIKDSRPPYTWAQLVTGSRPPASPDVATDFQRQFRGRRAETLLLRKNGGDIDAITASTITSVGVIGALRNAGDKLESALAATR
ncbi:MAG: FMN-binding protein [Planctomycetes bacterium]|nr:FMN-binding protein [Planctomycetota bacterium]